MTEKTKEILDEFIDRINGKDVPSNDGFGEDETPLKFDTYEDRFACYDMLNGRIWREYKDLGEVGICLCEFIEASYWLNRKAGIWIADPAREAILYTLLQDEENEEATKWLMRFNKDQREYRILDKWY